MSASWCYTSGRCTKHVCSQCCCMVLSVGHHYTSTSRSSMHWLGILATCPHSSWRLVSYLGCCSFHVSPQISGHLEVMWNSHCCLLVMWIQWWWKPSQRWLCLAGYLNPAHLEWLRHVARTICSCWFCSQGGQAVHSCSPTANKLYNETNQNPS